jgi:DNA-binding CsgD family transcriptional regulator
MLPMVLTDRHRQVLRLTAQGLRASEVAGRLWLSESTVKQHLAEVRWRLQAPNTTRAVVIALIQGELLLADLADDQASA